MSIATASDLLIKRNQTCLEHSPANMIHSHHVGNNLSILVG